MASNERQANVSLTESWSMNMSLRYVHTYAALSCAALYGALDTRINCNVFQYLQTHVRCAGLVKTFKKINCTIITARATITLPAFSMNIYEFRSKDDRR